MTRNFMEQGTKNRGKKNPSARALLLAGGLCLIACSPAYAASPEAGAAGAELPKSDAAADGNQIPEEQLGDSVIEYRELGSLIHRNNLSVREMVQAAEDTRQDYVEIRDYVSTEMSSASADKRDAKDAGDGTAYGEYAALEAVYRSAIKSYNQTLARLERNSSNKSRIALERQLTRSAQKLMISLCALRKEKGAMELTETLYRTRYEDAKRKQTVGMASEQEVLSAYHVWQDVVVSLREAEDNEASVRQNFFAILGMEDGQAIELVDIPAVDLERLSKLDLEADTQKAIGNHTELISVRSTESGGTAEIEKKFRTMDELEEKVRIKLRQRYEEIQQAKKGYEAAQEGYLSAQAKWEGANQKKALGMLSEADYLQAQISYVKKKTALEGADLTLLQALEEYDWAVRGLMELE